jgi:hypothetical protein
VSSEIDVMSSGGWRREVEYMSTVLGAARGYEIEGVSGRQLAPWDNEWIEGDEA